MGRHYGQISQDDIADVIRGTARESLKYARKELRQYRQHVNRAKITGKDTVEYMGGSACRVAESSLDALGCICEAFPDKDLLERLNKVLLRHAARLTRQFTTLYERDRDQVNAAHAAEFAAETAEFYRRIDRITGKTPTPADR